MEENINNTNPNSNENTGKETYEQKYQRMYYNTVTKAKRKKVAESKKEEKEKLKEQILTTPREITRICPICKKEYTELTTSIKNYKYKICSSCHNEKMKEYRKVPKNRDRANELRRNRYSNNPEFKAKLKESFKKYREKLKLQKQEILLNTPITTVMYKHTCPQCNCIWEEPIPSNTHSHPSKVCPACKENRRISELKKIRKPRGKKPKTLKAQFTEKRIILIKKNKNTVESEK